MQEQEAHIAAGVVEEKKGPTPKYTWGPVHTINPMSNLGARVQMDGDTDVQIDVGYFKTTQGHPSLRGQARISFKM